MGNFLNIAQLTVQESAARKEERLQKFVSTSEGGSPFNALPGKNTSHCGSGGVIKSTWGS